LPAAHASTAALELAALMASLKEQSPSVIDSSDAVFTTMVVPAVAGETCAEAGPLRQASNATNAARKATKPIVVIASPPVLDIHLLLYRWG